ncbi:hypothetical protein [Mesorhizobium sp. B2-4-17]|uniref:hypothetical protein n=1 Tax=Mesorhizobium sp. B2-4-17 TaxID=2589932 RepID=UPI001129D4F0|nr:hypothetical protein [Mesorhizobium sp. B2-4-17]TPK78217.1 hypothetical protein FJ548_25120 [Mesorhizobium sp. B2-4-17]
MGLQAGDGEFVMSAQNYDGDTHLPWSSWVEFAEQVVDADKTAREPPINEVECWDSGDRPEVSIVMVWEKA